MGFFVIASVFCLGAYADAKGDSKEKGQVGRLKRSPQSEHEASVQAKSGVQGGPGGEWRWPTLEGAKEETEDPKGTESKK